MTVERGSAEGQWITWLERITAEGPSVDPDALEIWGYTGRPSYAPGETVGLHVSTTAPTWGFEVWRDGSAFEKVHEQSGLPGARHPVGDDVVASGCGWPQGASFDIPDSWASGGYIVVLRGIRAGQEVTQDAILRAPAGRAGAPRRAGHGGGHLHLAGVQRLGRWLRLLLRRVHRPHRRPAGGARERASSPG